MTTDAVHELIEQLGVEVGRSAYSEYQGTEFYVVRDRGNIHR